MSTKRERLTPYGAAFDDLVEDVANALMASGYPSRHANPARAKRPVSDAELTGSVVAMGMLCESIDADMHPTNSLRLRTSTDMAGFLSLYASARRLIILLRAAQDSGSLTGRAAAEMDGGIDDLEELVRRPEDPHAITESTQGLIEAARPYQAQLPMAIQDTMEELTAML
jgi:hypothetical protein